MRDIWVDFNDVDSAGWTTTLAKFAEDGVELSIGMHVVAGDDDGNECDATVLQCQPKGCVTLALDLDTMRCIGGVAFAGSSRA